MKNIFLSLFALTLTCAVSNLQAQAPFIDPSTDSENFGSMENILFWTPEQKVAGFRNMVQLAPTRLVAAGPMVMELPEAHVDLGAVQVNTEDDSITVDEYFVKQNVAGLLVLKDGKIAYERYGLGNDQDSRWLSFSVTKSVVSMLVGAAVRDGYIKSVDEKVSDYLPRLKGTPYDQASIRDILQMASGVQWNEDYADPESDVNSASWETVALYSYLAQKPSDSTPGEMFNYNTAETNLVGTLLRSAIGNNLSTYLQEKVWQPYGMQADAYWNLTEPGGGEFGGCCINATLRDYGRLGLFALGNGHLPDGTPVLADNWMSQSVSPSAAYPGYGYLWWLEDDGSYSANGIFGQGICVYPEQNVVVVFNSARTVASDEKDWALQDALCQAVTLAVSE